MPDTAFAKVEDAIAAVIEPATGVGEPLEDFAVFTVQPEDEAVEAPGAIIIATLAATPAQADELGQTFWRQTVEIEVIDGPQESGSISRAVLSAMAIIHGLIAADRSLGGRLQDFQEIDLAGTQAEGKDVHGASVHYRAEFYTARDNWFTILGAGGATF